MMAIQDFGGLLFGGGGTGLEDYLSADQQSGIRNQAMLQAAAALLQAGGPSRTPISLGQALGGALQAGSAGYSQAQQGAVQSLLMRQKLQEGALEQARMQAYLNALRAEGGAPAVAGQGGIPAIPMGAGGVPPAGSAPTAMPMGAPASQGGGGMFAGLTPEQRKILPLMKPTEAIGEAFKAAGQRAALLSDQDLTSLGLPLGTLAYRLPSGETKIVSQKSDRLTESEITQLGLPPTTLAYRLPSGETKIVARPDYQYVETPAGGKQLIDMNNPLGIVPKPVQDRVIASGTVPKPTAGPPAYAGGFAPALKPEQIMTTVAEWDKNYKTPVDTVLSSYNIVKDLVTTGQAGISDYGVLIKAIKALEPNSAVMQGEAQSAQQMQAIADRMQGFLDKIVAGGVGSEQARLDLANLARSGAKVAIETYNRQADRKAGLLRQYAPQSVIDSTFQKFIIPEDIASKAKMEEAMKAGMAANPAATGTVLTFDPKTKTWSYK
jgi:hypothetical protein